MRGALRPSAPGRLGDLSRSEALTRVVPAILAVAGLLLLVLGFVMLSSWEISLFRFSSFDRDFSGSMTGRCGIPVQRWTHRLPEG
jgi:hypothetical protein